MTLEELIPKWDVSESGLPNMNRILSIIVFCDGIRLEKCESFDVKKGIATTVIEECKPASDWTLGIIKVTKLHRGKITLGLGQPISTI
jgi:hypothetical protein